MLPLTLLAEATPKPAGSPFDRPDLVIGTVGLAAALLVGAVAVYFVDRWRKQAALESRTESGAELTDFRVMYERGEITEAEYVRLRDKVAARVKAPPAAATPDLRASDLAAAARLKGTLAPPSQPRPAAPPPTPPAAAGPVLSGPLPPGYFDEPELSDRPADPPPPPSDSPSPPV